MKPMPFVALFCTGLVVAACARGCEKDAVIPDDDPIVTPSARTEVPKPSPSPEPSPSPTMQMKTYVVPQRAILGETFEVRAFVSSVEVLEVYADNFRLGFMGWNASCKCKSLMVKLNTAGERQIRFLNGQTELASEIIVIEAE